MSATEPSDRELLERWNTGDAECGSMLVRRHNRQLCLFLLSKVGPDALDDVTQAVYETLVRRANAIGEGNSVKGFLFGIARHKVIEHYRGKRKQRDRYGPLEYSVAGALGSSATQELQRQSEDQLAVLALRQLTIDDQMLLEMAVHLAMTRDELAQVYGTTAGQVGGRIHRAKKRLAKELQQLQASPAQIESTETSLESHWKMLRAISEKMLH